MMRSLFWALPLAWFLGASTQAYAQGVAEPILPVVIDDAPVASAPLADLKAQEAYGILQEGGGALPDTLWQGLNKAQLIDFLQRLPAANTSPTLRDLQRRLLLSAAAPPMDGAEGVFLPRLKALLAMGHVAGAEALLAVAPPTTAPAAAHELIAAAQLFTAPFDKHCPDWQEQIAQNKNNYKSDFWARVKIICLLHTQRAAEAILHLDVLREQMAKTKASADENLFVEWADALAAGQKLVWPKKISPSLPETLALWRMSGQAPGALPLTTPKAVQQALALWPIEAANLVPASEAATLFDLQPAAQLAETYSAITPLPEERLQKLPPATRAAQLRATWWRQASSATSAETVVLLDRYVRSLTPAQQATPLALLATKILSGMDAGQSPLTRQQRFIALFIVHNQTEAANQWLENLNAPLDKPTDVPSLALVPLLQTTDITSDVSLNDWLVANKDNKAANVTDILMVLNALGVALPQADDVQNILAAISTQNLPEAEMLQQLDAAATAGHIGHALLLIQTIMGDRPPSIVPVAVSAAAIQALRKIDMPDEAKKLAQEVLLGLLPTEKVKTKRVPAVTDTAPAP